MTTEVVVMNRGGVALATDSAVTVQLGNTSKVRDSALKLFMLSECRPVAVMVYENSALLGVPWETIFKLFRQWLGRRSYETLPEYGKALIDFLDGNDSLFPADVQDRYYLGALQTEFRRIKIAAEREFLDASVHMIGDPEAPGGDGTASVKRAIEKAESSWANEPDASYFKSIEASDIAGRNSGGVHELINGLFGNWVPQEEDRRRLHGIAEHLIAKDRFPAQVLSGVVVAGFGENEHFPSVQHIEIGGVYDGKLKVRPYELTTVSEEHPSHVMAFAHTEMVEGFLAGISELAGSHLYDAAVFIREMPVVALDVVQELTPEQRETYGKKMNQVSRSKASEFVRMVVDASEARREEIEAAVQGLTIKELAHVASTLVSLSSFHQQMSLARRTVGGPVDVAVVSKGDGFIWIERKHYFRPELNHHFFQNYGASNDDTGARQGKRGDHGG